MEKPAESESSSQSNSLEVNYWMLKIWGFNWDLPSLKEGDEGYFNSSPERPDFRFFSSIKIGDQGFAYDYSTDGAIVFLFDVTKPLRRERDKGDVFSFRITKILKDPIELISFQGQVTFSQELDAESPARLITLTDVEYNSLVRLTETSGSSGLDKVFNKASLSEIFSDNSSKEIKDQLGFQSDVDALASIIAYKEVKPPLAIGLFGNWGSGKSFFMSKLQQKINDLSTGENPVFCKKVLQINFNSWHYSDSNLWASLITKIFEDLEKFGSKKENELNELFKNLNSTKELLREEKEQKARVDQEIQVLNSKKKIVDQVAEAQSQDLRSLSFKEILDGLMQDPSIKDEFERLKKDYSFLDLKGYEDIELNLRKLDDGSDKAAELFKVIKSLGTSQNIIFTILSAALLWAVIYFLEESMSLIEAKFKLYFGVSIGIVSASLAGIVRFLRPAFKRMDSALNRLKSLYGTIAGLRANAGSKFTAQQDELKRKISDTQAQSVEIQKNISLLEVEQSKLQQNISDITSGQKIIRFIETRVSDVRYINSLGIISWIRKDFEQLDLLLRQQGEAQRIVREGVEVTAKTFELERIILYIDDLDRCSESLVVKVLEAIHLLLAFPLFVVVVGVDPRWVHNALNLQYASLLSGDNAGNRFVENENGQRPNGLIATSYDYLEKIFQIPFALKAIN